MKTGMSGAGESRKLDLRKLEILTYPFGQNTFEEKS